uniref:Uncharacterized protein n=1 Tax=Leersia perrieri TaxID=77586 RepID=A0A0D9W5V1_9ORYZ
MAAPTLSLPISLCSASSPRHATLLALPCRTAAQPLASPGRCPARSDVPSPRRAGGLALAPCAAKRGGGGGRGVASDDGGGAHALLQASLWGAEAAYILWLFLLPYAPGDPIWAISQSTISDLIGLSLNFFFVLPFLNSAFLIPYMAIRLNDPDMDNSPQETSKLGSVMVRGATIVGLTGGVVCVGSIAWALFGRADAGFGGIAERWQYVQSYVFSERLAYAFLWDILLYSIFQPWLIGDNIDNVKADATEFVNSVSNSNRRPGPVIGKRRLTDGSHGDTWQAAIRAGGHTAADGREPRDASTTRADAAREAS